MKCTNKEILIQAGNDEKLIYNNILTKTFGIYYSPDILFENYITNAEKSRSLTNSNQMAHGKVKKCFQ